MTLGEKKRKDGSYYTIQCAIYPKNLTHSPGSPNPQLYSLAKISESGLWLKKVSQWKYFRITQSSGIEKPRRYFTCRTVFSSETNWT